MKSRFNNFDIICGVQELQKLIGLRVNQIYDINSKTFLIRLHGKDNEKQILLIESGIRFHTTVYQWPKNVAPSGICMKLRKHLKNKRLESCSQLGADRIVDFQFGEGNAAYHVILELYDRGNIILTDNELTIIYILRPHCDGEEIRFAISEKYPVNRVKSPSEQLSDEQLRQLIANCSTENSLRKILMSIADCGPSVIDHFLAIYELDNCLIKTSKLSETLEMKSSTKTSVKKYNKEHFRGRVFNIDIDMPRLINVFKEINELLEKTRTSISKGYIFQTVEETLTEEGGVTHHCRNEEYHPYLFAQYKDCNVIEFDSFMLAVDEFYSNLEAQKIDMKALQQEQITLKKLSNVKKDHAKRLEDLNKSQELDRRKADLISSNQILVDNAILAIKSAIANQMSWPNIHELVKEAQSSGDPVACCIRHLKLETNHISLCLNNPYENENQDDIVDIDLSLTAWANARHYYDRKRSAAQKEIKTIDASKKALKSAEKKTHQTLKDVRTISTITKARKVYWFEKFYWFISSENFLVIGGRDAQQNELIVKRYMRQSDVYVHAEIQGGSSVIVRNFSNAAIPPKTLLEAGTMAISYSVAWDAKIVTNAYWVHSNQVSKKAPTGEFLGTGSFMIRGKKNFLPFCPLAIGISILFKVEDNFIERHTGERKVKVIEDELCKKNFQACSGQSNENISETQNDCNKNSEEKESNETQSDFPNTEIIVEHFTGCIKVRNDSICDSAEEGNKLNVEFSKFENTLEDATLVTANLPRKNKIQTSKKQKIKKKEPIEIKQQINDVKENNSVMKRGQKGKLKKIKLKYKNQDDEERGLRMMILNSSANKASKNTLENQNESNNVETIISEKQEPKKKTTDPDIEIDEIDEVLPTDIDLEILNSLTGQPFEDDTTLFAIPVVAPYQALQQYKFKVKLIPGSGKRGKAGKTAIAMFLKDKKCTVREKDLIKSIQEESLVRNIPGKVKLSGPQIPNMKK